MIKICKWLPIFMWGGVAKQKEEKTGKERERKRQRGGWQATAAVAARRGGEKRWWSRGTCGRIRASSVTASCLSITWRESIARASLLQWHTVTSRVWRVQHIQRTHTASDLRKSSVTHYNMNVWRRATRHIARSSHSHLTLSSQPLSFARSLPPSSCPAPFSHSIVHIM